MTDRTFGAATGWLMLASGIVMLIGPLVTAASGVLVGRDSGSEDYAMALMTPLTARDIVSGYLTASLARMRALLALAVGLMPALVVGSVQFFIMTAVIFFKIANSSPMSLGPNAGTSQPAPSEGIIPGGLMSALFLLVMASGLALLGAALGVFFGLVVRRPGLAASAAGTLAGLITLGVVMFPMSTDFFPMLGDGALLGVALMEIVAVYAIARWVLKAAQRHARPANPL